MASAASTGPGTLFRVVVERAGRRSELTCGTREHCDRVADAATAVLTGVDLAVHVEAPGHSDDVEVPLAHVWGQAFWHSPVVVAANESGAVALLLAVRAALTGEDVPEVFTVDGEGYSVDVELSHPDDGEERRFDPWQLPYTDPVASGGPDVDGLLNRVVTEFEKLSDAERVDVPVDLVVALGDLRRHVHGEDPADPRQP